MTTATTTTPWRHDFTTGAPANRPTHVLSRDEIRQLAPSVFATAARDDVSSRYRFIPTTEVLDILEDRGFRPVKAGQTIVKVPDLGSFARHVLRFRHESNLATAVVGGEVPELVLLNSHDRTSAYQLMAGIFRLVCSNGLVVQSADFGSISVRHSGSHEFGEQVIDATYRIIEETPRIMGQIEAWKQVALEPPQRLALATAAMELRENKVVTPAQILVPRRPEDKATDLWTTAQVVQENIVQGGQRGRNARGGRATTRPIKSVNEDIKTNKALWRLTEEMAKLVGAN